MDLVLIFVEFKLFVSEKWNIFFLIELQRERLNCSKKWEMGADDGEDNESK